MTIYDFIRGHIYSIEEASVGTDVDGVDDAIAPDGDLRVVLFFLVGIGIAY